MVDLIGPDAAGATPTLTTTADVTSPVAGDTWFEDCVSGSAGVGTPIVAKWLNWLMQQSRVAIRASAVPVSNSYDNMLSWAMQSGYVNWINFYTGTANALVGNADNNPIFIAAGTVVRGIVTSGTNTGATTFNWSGLGAQPVVRADGSACTGGEIVNGDRLCLLWDGTGWAIISPPPLSWLLPKLSQIDIQTFDASGTWNAPAGFAAASTVIIEIWGGGGGGVSTAGGAGGAYERYDTYLGALPSSVAVAVGAPGAGTFDADPSATTVTAASASTFASGLYGNKFTAAGGPGTGLGLHAHAKIVSSFVGDGGICGTGIVTPGGEGFFGCGGGSGPGGIAGASTFGGAGGAEGAVGNVPGGGGGCAAGGSGNGFAGAHGRVRVTTIQA